MDRLVAEICHFAALLTFDQWYAMIRCLLLCVHVMVMPRRQLDYRMMRFADRALPNDPAFNTTSWAQMGLTV